MGLPNLGTAGLLGRDRQGPANCENFLGEKKRNGPSVPRSQLPLSDYLRTPAVGTRALVQRRPDSMRPPLPRGCRPHTRACVHAHTHAHTRTRTHGRPSLGPWHSLVARGLNCSRL